MSTTVVEERVEPDAIVERPRVVVDAFHEYRTRSRFSALDGLRALSILAVIWHHTAHGFGAFTVTERGFLGVDVFFVLSGFLIVTLILRERDRTGGVSLRGFYARRTLRIFPIYFLLLGAITLFVTVIRPSSGMRAGFLDELPYYLTYTSNWIQASTFLAIAWSLATEEQFYVLWPPIEKLFPRAAIGVLIGAIAVNELVSFGALDGVLASRFGLHRADYAILQATFAPICFGVLLAHTLHRRASFERVRAILGRREAPWIALAVFLAAASVPGDLAGLPRLVIGLAETAFLASVVLQERHPIARALAWPWLARIGAISYGMYLGHHLARHGAAWALGKAGIASPVVLFVACTLVTIAVAEASFRLIEAPILGWKRRLGRARAAADVPASPVARGEPA